MLNNEYFTYKELLIRNSTSENDKIRRNFGIGQQSKKISQMLSIIIN